MTSRPYKVPRSRVARVRGEMRKAKRHLTKIKKELDLLDLPMGGWMHRITLEIQEMHDSLTLAWGLKRPAPKPPVDIPLIPLTKENHDVQ
jgi:hypothetical protein